jgi:hypothetical protein
LLARSHHFTSYSFYVFCTGRRSPWFLSSLLRR